MWAGLRQSSWWSYRRFSFWAIKHHDLIVAKVCILTIKIFCDFFPFHLRFDSRHNLQNFYWWHNLLSACTYCWYSFVLVLHKLSLQIWLVLLHIHKYASGLYHTKARKFVNRISNCLLKMGHKYIFKLQHDLSEECLLDIGLSKYLNLNFLSQVLL